MLKPSDFISYPWSSVLKCSESEVIALNIMKIRKRLGDLWPLTWEQYREERMKDGNFTVSEHSYFEEVMPLIATAEQSVNFCEDWRALAVRL